MTHIHYSWAEAHEEHAVLLVLRTELGHNDVQGGLGGRVQSGDIDVEVVDQIEICMATSNGDHLLGFALHHKREEELEEVNVAGGVDLVELG